METVYCSVEINGNLQSLGITPDGKIVFANEAYQLYDLRGYIIESPIFPMYFTAKEFSGAREFSVFVDCKNKLRFFENESDNEG